jgi:cytochrome b561
MDLEIRKPGFARTMQMIHWGTAALSFGSDPAAWMVGTTADSAEKAWLAMVHRSVGVAILLLKGMRLVYRQFTKAPSLPADVHAALRRVARASDALLCVLPILQPVLGSIDSMLLGDRIVIWGEGNLPLLLPVTRLLRRRAFQIHRLIALLSRALIGLHIVAALYHHFVRRNGALAGMLPGARCLASTVDLAAGGLPDGGIRPQ